MSLKGHKQVFVCLAGGLLASTALAVSYRDWVALPAPAAAALSILLEPASNGCVEATQSVDQSERGYGRTDSKNRHEVPSRPAGGYLGQMIIRQHPGARLDFPLTVSISFPEVLIEDLLPPVAQRHSISNVATKLLWHQPMGLLNPVSPVRPERFRHSWSITHASPTGSVTLLPLILSRMTAGGFRSGGSANLSSCLCEVRDASGTVLLRKQLVELFCPGNGYGGGGTAWVMNEPEADRFLRESASINNSQTIGALPPLIESYAEINALWISDEATRSATLTRAMLRRLLLMGTWIYGRNMTVSNLTAMAGLSGAGSVLLGGIQGVALPLANNSEAKSHQSHNNENTLWDNYSYINNQNGITNALTVMQNRRDLFQPLKSRYLGWTYSVLGIFFGVACIGLPVAFWRLKSSRRLMLWWLIPLTTVLISGVSLIGGKWLLPRQPQADITEYRFAVAGWPEVFCRSVSRSLTFEERQVSWKMPADHFIFPVR
ncbi:MAG: hypothetical protein WCL16_14485, partial [bacterium]